MKHSQRSNPPPETRAALDRVFGSNDRPATWIDGQGAHFTALGDAGRENERRAPGCDTQLEKRVADLENRLNEQIGTVNDRCDRLDRRVGDVEIRLDRMANRPGT